MAQTKRFRSGHVIEEFSVKLNKIICVCSWEGDADIAWKEHKLIMKEDKIEMTKIPTYFNGGRAV